MPFRGLTVAPDLSHWMYLEWQCQLSNKPFPCPPSWTFPYERMHHLSRQAVAWILVKTSYPQRFSAMLLWKGEAVEKTFHSNRAKPDQERFQGGNLLEPLAIWSFYLILMVTGIFSQGRAVCNLCFSMAGWLGRARSSGKTYCEGDWEVNSHGPSQRKTSVAPGGEGLEWKMLSLNERWGYPDTLPLATF